MDRRTATSRILAANKPLIRNLLKAKENSEGYSCQIFYPVISENIYDTKDKFLYKKKPDIDKLFIILSAIQESWMGTADGKEFDPFLNEQPQILTTFDQKLPKMSKVIVFYNNSFRVFRVQHHKSYDGDGPYLIRNELQPLS